MTLVLDKGSGGPGVHALIIGVDDVSESGPAPLSAAISAAEIVRWLSVIDIADVPIASIELLAGELRLPESYGSKTLPSSEPPHLAAVQSAVRAWRGRLDKNERNLAFFFFAGPITDFGKEVYLQVGEPGAGHSGTDGCLSLANLSNGMGESRAGRQLYFIDGCWSVQAKRKPAYTKLFHDQPAGPVVARAHYVARTAPGSRPSSAYAGPLTGLAYAFLRVYGDGERREAPITAVELGQQLRLGFQRAMREMRLTHFSEMETSWNRDFDLRAKTATKPVSEQPASEPPAPEQSAPAPSEESQRENATVKPGDVLNGLYQVTRLIARGSRGEMFEGRQIETGKKVAIKVLPSAFLVDEGVKARVYEEVRALFRLDHPALANYRELSPEWKLGALYVVADFIEGTNLSAVLGALKPTPEALAALLQRLASGLRAAHAVRVVHRHLSPDNILLPGGDLRQATIIDFGIAKDLDWNAKAIVDDAFADKLSYAAPEQIGGFDQGIGPWTDVYSLALVILAVAQGRDVSVTRALNETIDPGSESHDLAAVPSALRPLLASMLRPNPVVRLRSMDEVLDLLGAIAPAEQDVGPPRSGPSVPKPAIEGAAKQPDEVDKLAPARIMAARMDRLTDRQQQCLELVHSGWSTARIAKRLGVDGRSVSEEIDVAVRTLGAANRKAAARLFHDFTRVLRPDEPEPGAASDTDAWPEAGTEAGAESAEPEAARSPLKAAQPTQEANTHFVSDDPEVERDGLGRGPLAIALARRLHRIWCRSNGVAMLGEAVEAGAEDRAAFVLHLDAPWGGGKTSFANFLARVLNPFPAGCKGPAHFLAERAGGTEAVGTIFIDDPPATADPADPAADWPEDARRPWIVVPFNAWQAEHCAPPWWVFYQAIRKGCFKAVWAEGREASALGQSTVPRRPSLARRIGTWVGLWAREIGWRLRNPKIMALLATAAIAGALILVLALTGVIFSGGDNGTARDFNASDAFGSILIGVGGISGLWGLGALLTESVAPGTDAVAERRSLGGGDPFDRFRRHFSRTMAAVRRPVMVIVDDLDRCRPDFVVDLIRGIQTLLRSPRVVFVILGDRDWIERAFEAHHDAMKKVNVGAEQTFGARFVEKAIQMSFILPEMPDERQDGYVRRVLLGPGAQASGTDAAPPPPADLSQQLRADYRETVASAETAEDRKEAEQLLRDKYQAAFQASQAATEAGAEAIEAAAPGAAPPAIPDAETAGAQADKLLGEERAMLAAVDERMGKALLHRLEPLARAFPANPRQIKRIVNAITMYTCVAYLQMDMDETDERGVELAIWVILMTEWPATWRLLAGCPDLLAAITAGKAADAKKALRAIDATLLPGSAEATLEEIMRIRADARLQALITGDAATGAPALTLPSVREFRSLTPLYAGKRKLAAGAGDAPAGRGGGG